jgi:hypothetical protein
MSVIATTTFSCYRPTPIMCSVAMLRRSIPKTPPSVMLNRITQRSQETTQQEVEGM